MKNFTLQFGGKITKELEREYSHSNNWRNGKFHNLEDTNLDISLRKIPGVLCKQLSSSKEKEPPFKLPIIPFDNSNFLNASSRAQIIWYGHSAIMMRMQGKTILIDPMLGTDTTPIAPISTKRFSDNTLSLIDDFPEIDLLLITHDHYDHLDFDSIQKLKAKTKRYFVALGVKRHLVRWGINDELITEFDWWDTQNYEGIDITFSPTQHFSGRGLTDRTKSLWGGWAFNGKEEKLWFSGDGGYGVHFKEIGDKLGPFDFGFMECGQYNEDWRPVHMFPDESVQAAIDGKVRKAMPVHWAGFALSYQHTWKEPADEFVKSAKLKGLDFAIPKLGQQFEIPDSLNTNWWD